MKEILNSNEFIRFLANECKDTYPEITKLCNLFSTTFCNFVVPESFEIPKRFHSFTLRGMTKVEFDSATNRLDVIGYDRYKLDGVHSDTPTKDS